MAGPIPKSTGGVMPPAQTSAKVWTPAGTGSRPTKSSFNTPTSAPKDPRTLGRATPGWLK